MRVNAIRAGLDIQLRKSLRPRMANAFAFKQFRQMLDESKFSNVRHLQRIRSMPSIATTSRKNQGRELIISGQKPGTGAGFFPRFPSRTLVSLLAMPRRARQAVGGLVYHVINRGCGRMKLFGRNSDYEGFIKLLEEALRRVPGVRILAFCLMPNHWHLVLLPTSDGDLSRFMFWLTMTHVQRWRHSRRLVGLGPLYQGRFRAFVVEADAHFLTVNRYVERNALSGETCGTGRRLAMV